MLTCIQDDGAPDILCQCDCGNKKWLTRGNFIHGAIKSCGCLRSKGKISSLVGQKFGMLTVLEELGENKIRCRCDCGKECIRTKSMVKAGKCISCGCEKRRNKPEEKIIKKPIKSKNIFTEEYMLSHKFGHLQPILSFHNKSDSYLCKCDCGNMVTRKKTNLINGLKKGKQYCSGKCPLRSTDNIK